MAAAAYGKTWADADWELVKQADLNHDNQMGIEDLAVVAQKILESLYTCGVTFSHVTFFTITTKGLCLAFRRLVYD
ncbi:hypothetical protein CF651_15210 [Paenibacillus rigui]|uniref:EF-hand domain-containing protein n=2 Tax=Paenibacillus rigui TaxID=554312 RepID=A0A229UQ85_9BACL|nr:hypothetical protein CF651_15210 [Paenibacillus rigui]